MKVSNTILVGVGLILTISGCSTDSEYKDMPCSDLYGQWSAVAEYQMTTVNPTGSDEWNALLEEMDERCPIERNDATDLMVSIVMED